MSKYKELYAECELEFGKVVRAAKGKDPNALWLLFEYIEFRLTKQREYESASTKRNSKENESKQSGDDDGEEQFSFGFLGRSGH